MANFRAGTGYASLVGPGPAPRVGSDRFNRAVLPSRVTGSKQTRLSKPSQPARNTTPDISAWKRDLEARLAASDAAVNALYQAQMAAQPRLPTGFNSVQAARNARQLAVKKVNPVFQKKLNQFMANANKTKKNTVAGFNLERTSTDRALSENLEDIGISRERTEEDVTRELGRIGATEETFQEVEGRQADTGRQQLEEQVGASGLGESGLGRQQVSSYIRDRNVEAKTQEEAFEDAKTAQVNLKERTFGDLMRGEGRSKAAHKESRKQIKLNQEEFMNNWNYRTKSFKLQNELEKGAEILRQAQQNYQNTVARRGQQFLSSGRYRPKDIELFYNVYR